MQCMRSSDGSNVVIPNIFVRCVHPTHRRSSMGNPGAPSPLCSAVGQRARSERVLSTLDPSSGPAATIKCWHAHGVHARQGFVRGERRGTVARRAGRRLECAPRVRSQGAAPARLGLDSRSRRRAPTLIALQHSSVSPK